MLLQDDPHDQAVPMMRPADLPQVPGVTFDAIGTEIQVAVLDPAALPEAEAIARELIGALDRSCSRFRDDSDLARVNRSAGRWAVVDPLLVHALTAAVTLAEDTDGLVDPLLGKVMVSWGYDRDFAQLHPVGEPTVAQVRPYAWKDIGLRDRAVKIPVGSGLDLGSIAKAWGSDVVAATIHQRLGVPVLASLGGDVAIAGDAQWPIAVADEEAAQQLIYLDGGGLATSGTRARRWTYNGVRHHHILDPRTGRSVSEVWRQVSATGPSCAAANAASTAAVVLGADAPAWLQARGVDARLVAADGSVRCTGDWPQETA